MTDNSSGGRTHKDQDQFFDRELMPLASRLKSEGVVFLETARADGATSYYVQRPASAMDRAAFEWGGVDSADQLEAALARLWQDPASKPLAGLAPSLAKLALALYQVEDQPGEVSSFVYVMY